MSDLKRGLQATLANNSVAYGFSVMITASYGTVSLEATHTRVGDIFLFVLGASLAFALIEMVVSGLFRRQMDEEPTDVVALGSAFALFSVSAGVGAATVVASIDDGWTAWPAAAFAASSVYVLMAGLELALAVRLKEGR